VAQPLVLNAVTKVAAEYLPASLRPHGIAVGSAGIFAGMLLALVLGTAFGGGHIAALLIVEAALAVVAALALCAELTHRGVSDSREEEVAVGIAALRVVWADQGVRLLSGLLFIGFGAFIALTTWLQALLHHYGVSAGTAGTLLVGMVLVGAIGAAALPPVVVRRHAEGGIVAASVLVTCAGGIVLAFVHAVAIDAIVLLPIGLLLLTDLPVILELSERRAGRAAGTVTALLWLSGNLGGLVVALGVQLLIHHPTPAFLLLAAVALCAIPLLLRLRPVLARWRSESATALASADPVAAVA
jgi:cyanate permease